jgi:hypothetical protein
VNPNSDHQLLSLRLRVEQTSVAIISGELDQLDQLYSDHA